MSDDNEIIRKLALKVVRILIKKFAKTNMNQIVIPVKQGLFSANRGSRLNSVKLLGEIIN